MNNKHYGKAGRGTSTARQLRVALMCVLLWPSIAGAQIIRTLAEYDREVDRDSRPVIISLEVPEARAPSSRGDWENLNDYIDRVQRELAEEMGWRNFNEIVAYEHVPAMARSVSREEARRLLDSPRVSALFANRWNTAELEESVRLAELPSAWRANARGQGQRIAVIDTGIDLDHAFFRGKLVDGACFSHFRSCPGNQQRAFGVAAGDALARHGSHVGGIAAGRNGSLTGAAPDAGLISIQAFSEVENRVGALDSDILAALDWLYGLHERAPVAAVNLSLGSGGGIRGYCDDENPFGEIFKLLHQAGVVVVAASGNDGQIQGVNSPACVSTALTVGSLTKDGEIAPYSNSGRALDIVAPGDAIYSAVPGGEFTTLSGTSMAAPHVAGAVAVLRSAWPEASADELVRALTDNGTTFRDPRNGRETAMLDVEAAMAWLADRFEPPPEASPPDEPAPAPPAPADPPPVQDPDLPPCRERIDGILIEREPPCREGEGA